MLNVKVINKSNNELPRYMTSGSACMDVSAFIPDPQVFIRLQPNETVAIPTGLYMQLPEGYEMQVRSRSGLALKSGIIVANSPGCIDSDYINEVKVILHNTTDRAFYVRNGDRIAQLKLSESPKFNWVEVEELDATDRKGGFGSTGI